MRRLERETRSLEIDAPASIKKGGRKTRARQPKGRTDAESGEVGKAKADLQSTISGVPALSPAREAKASLAFFVAAQTAASPTFRTVPHKA
jgi:hypothetical protein